jgi:hypothetical protein
VALYPCSQSSSLLKQKHLTRTYKTGKVIHRVQNKGFAGCSLRQLPGRVSISSQEGHYFCPEEISILSRGGQHSFPRRSAFLPEEVSIFDRRSSTGGFDSVRAKKVLICGAFAVVVTPVAVGDTTGFSDAFPRRSAFLPEQISISD